MLHEANVGYYDLQNTRISKHRDIFNSTLGIYNPLEYAIGGLAALMPTIDINTQRNSGGIGNAWDFWDIQRVWSASDRWSLVTGRHTLQAGVEYRHIGLEGRVHGAHQRRPRLRQLGALLHRATAPPAAAPISIRATRGATSRANDIGGFVQDDWQIGGGLTLNAGLRYDIYGNFTERNGRVGNYYLPDVGGRAGRASPDFRCPATRRSSSPDFTPLSIGLVRRSRAR